MYFSIVKESRSPRRTYLAIHKPAVAILYWFGIANDGRFQGVWLKAASRGQFDPASWELPPPPRCGSGQCRGVTNDTEAGGRQLRLRPTPAPMRGVGSCRPGERTRCRTLCIPRSPGPPSCHPMPGRRKRAAGSSRDYDGDRRHLAQAPAGAVSTRGPVLASGPRSASDATCCWLRRQPDGHW